jgi:hypothetical protein
VQFTIGDNRCKEWILGIEWSVKKKIIEFHVNKIQVFIAVMNIKIAISNKIQSKQKQMQLTLSVSCNYSDDPFPQRISAQVSMYLYQLIPNDNYAYSHLRHLLPM